MIIAATLLTLPEPGDGAWQLVDVITNDRLRWTLGLGATAGIATMALALIPAVLRTGFRFRPVWNWRHPAVRRLLTMSAWTLGYVAANQAALIVVRNLTDPGSGDAAAYFDAFTFFVLPHGLLAVSIATTFQPEMSRAVARRERASFIRQMSLGMRMIALFTIPAGVGIFVLRRTIVGALLQHGEYGAADALATSRALAGFALGLVGFSVYLFVLRGFYAHHDTRTPFVINVFENVINVVLAIVLVERYGVLGLGLAFALAYLMAAGWVLQIMSYKVPGFPVREILRSLWPMLLAAAVMGEVVWLVARCHRQQQRHRCGVATRGRRAVRDRRLRRVADGSPDTRIGRRSRSAARVQKRRETVGFAPCSSSHEVVEVPDSGAHREVQRERGPDDPARAGHRRVAGSAPPAQGAGRQRHRQPEAGRDPSQRQDGRAREAQRQRPPGADHGGRRREGRQRRQGGAVQRAPPRRSPTS